MFIALFNGFWDKIFNVAIDRSKRKRSIHGRKNEDRNKITISKRVCEILVLNNIAKRKH